MAKTAITPTRAENYPEWYQQVVRAADMADSSPVRGCMAIRRRRSTSIGIRGRVLVHWCV
ncbi:MAG: hypothetical protein WD534_18085 [Phycisphaeraceae bacterium]